MKKVLQVVTLMNRGGEETMIMNYYRNMDRTKIQFDFLVHYATPGVYDEEIRALGGTIYHAFPIRPWSYGKYQKWLRKFFEEHKGEYVAVHAHILENCGFCLRAAKEVGIPVRIAHSHLADIGVDYKYFFRKYGKNVLKKCENTHNFACGYDAGKYLFDNRFFEVVPNAVDTVSFGVNKTLRNDTRKALGLTNETAYGNVARFHPVKNQTYLVDIFEEIVKLEPNSKLFFVGVGGELENVKKKVISKHLEDKIIFLGLRADIPALLNAFDAIVFPSKLEGLPLSLVEAQSTGLRCFLSDHVAKETALTPLVSFIPLENSPKEWAKEIVKEMSKWERPSKEEAKRAIVDVGYDIYTNASKLQQIYLGERKSFNE